MAVLLIYVALISIQLHFGFDGPLERDAYFHARFSRMLPERGLSRSFPWTQVSTWKDRFCDKDFLFHVFLFPFTRVSGEPLPGAQAGMIILTLAVVGAIYGVLRAQNVPWAVGFAALILCMGWQFLFRLTMVRSHVLSMVLGLVGMHFLLASRWKPLAALGFVYAWSYSFPYVLPMLAVPFVVGRWLSRGGLDWKSPLAAFVGVSLGLVAHPYTPHSLEGVLTLVRIMAQASTRHSEALLLGGEFYPRPARWMLANYPLFIASAVALGVVGVRWRKRLRPETVGTLVCAEAWFAMSLAFPRFVEYSAPLFVLCIGLVARDLLVGVNPRAWLERHRSTALPALAAVVFALGALHAQSLLTLYARTARVPGPRFRGASQWLATHTEPEETVMNFSWSDFPELFYDGYRQHFIWGIDPTFSLLADEERGRLLNGMQKGTAGVDFDAVGRIFGARYAVLGKGTGVLRHGASRVVYEDEHAWVYDLRPRGSTSSNRGVLPGSGP